MAALLAPLSLATLRDGETIDVDVEAPTRAALAERLGLLSLDRLKYHVLLARDGATVTATGRVQASLTQACVGTGEPVAAMIDEAFALDFRPEPGSGKADEEVELDAADMDVIFHDGRTIDLGAALVDTLSLAIDPYPRSAAADTALKDAGVLSEEDASPFAALAALKDRLGKTDGD